MTNKEIKKYILQTAKYALTKRKVKSDYQIYINFLTKSGLLLYEDKVFDTSILNELIEENKVKLDFIGYNQGEQALKYKFIGYDYPKTHYRNISNKLRKQVLKKFDNECNYCGNIMNLSIDHIIPFSKGGKTEIDNLQVLCRSCNSSKGNRT